MNEQDLINAVRNHALANYNTMLPDLDLNAGIREAMKDAK